MKRLLKRLSLQWRITLLTILLLATACVTMKTLLCSSGHAYMDSIGNYVMHYVQEDPQAIRVDIPNEQWKDLSERFNGEFVLELSGAKFLHSRLVHRPGGDGAGRRSGVFRQRKGAEAAEAFYRKGRTRAAAEFDVNHPQ
jgi:hypothetical protein